MIRSLLAVCLLASAAGSLWAQTPTAEPALIERAKFFGNPSKIGGLHQRPGRRRDFLLYGVNVASGAQRNYTPFEKTRVQVVHISRKVKNRILVGVNNRDPRWHDVYSLELATAKLSLVFKNEGYADFVSDDRLALRVAAKARDDGGYNYHRVSGGKVDAKPMAEVGLEDS